MRKFIVCIAIALCLGCGSAPPVVGVVAEKEYVPRRSQAVLVPSGKGTKPSMIFYSERYVLHLKVPESTSNYTCDVDKDVYDKTSVGESFTC